MLTLRLILSVKYLRSGTIVNMFFAEGVSPRSSSLTSVVISYDTLADLVYYCNEHRLSASLVYNTSLGVYVGFWMIPVSK